eukprot:1303627-Rhodomonas_salina.2
MSQKHFNVAQSLANPSSIVTGDGSHQGPAKSTGKRAAQSSDAFRVDAGAAKRPRLRRRAATDEEKAEASLRLHK